MRKHLVNAIYGVLDYASYPFGMLLVVPIILHKLGASEYGLWMIAIAIVGTGGIIASDFFRAVAFISLGGRAAMLVLVIYLLHHMSLRGLTTARVCYGLVASLAYLPLLRALGTTKKESGFASGMAISWDLQEGSQP
jgi:hypothetical protein